MDKFNVTKPVEYLNVSIQIVEAAFCLVIYLFDCLFVKGVWSVKVSLSLPYRDRKSITRETEGKKKRLNSILFHHT